ncbi:hypothetical protein QBC37DRAFT_181078 [Rhypophila decipiens]|uniref:Uncharacterized protein n=1 Tax=Rhypophila decipiens TaxID=261697 RepID=A0AAN6Y5V6_9PEZI|nr:hypothetical protein QBC37DRAFT_181078 [Rhypophila decipiens]
MVFLGAVSVIIRSGAHIGFDFIQPIWSIDIRPDDGGLVGDMIVPILPSHTGLDVVYYGFGFASFVFGIGTLARLNTLILIGLLPEKKHVRQPRDGARLFWVGPLVLLWITFSIVLTKEIHQTLQHRVAKAKLGRYCLPT